MKIVWLLFFMPTIAALPDIGNLTEEYKDCVRECQYIYNPRYQDLKNLMVRFNQWHHEGIIPEHEFMEEWPKLERELAETAPIICKEQNV